MPKYYEGKEEDNSPCAGVKEDLKTCLLESACVLIIRRQSCVAGVYLSRHTNIQVYGGARETAVRQTLEEGKTPKECLKEGHCRALQVTFFECKRSILDNRARFRGRKGY